MGTVGPQFLMMMSYYLGMHGAVASSPGPSVHLNPGESWHLTAVA